MEDIVVPLLDKRYLAFQLLVDDRSVVGVQRAHIDSTHESNLIAIGPVQLQKVHPGFDLDNL